MLSDILVFIPKFAYLFNHLYFMKLFEINCAPMSYLRDLPAQELTTQSSLQIGQKLVPRPSSGTKFTDAQVPKMK